MNNVQFLHNHNRRYRSKYFRDYRKKHHIKLSNYAASQINYLVEKDQPEALGVIPDRDYNKYLPKLHRISDKKIMFDDLIGNPLRKRYREECEKETAKWYAAHDYEPSDEEIEKIGLEIKKRIFEPHKSNKKVIFVNIDVDKDSISILNENLRPASYTDAEIKEIKEAVLSHKQLPNINYIAFISVDDASSLNKEVIDKSDSIIVLNSKGKNILYTKQRKAIALEKKDAEN